MLWYNILNPKAWPGVSIRTGNNKIDGVYYNLLSSNHVSLAASGSMFLAANSGIKLISPSFVETSGFRANTILAENFGKINISGEVIPLYSGANSGLIFKQDDSTLVASDIITYDENSNTIRFPSATNGSLLYIEPSFINQGELVPASKKIASFDGIELKPADTVLVNDQIQISNPASITLSVKMSANSGISLGPNNNLNSYSGFILTHDGSGNVAQWKPATYLRENHNKDFAFEGLERIGINWIRYPKRPAILSNGKLYLYNNTRPRSWSPYSAFSSVEQIIEELGSGTDTICVETTRGEIIVGYTKFAFVEKSTSQLIIEEDFGNLEDRIEVTTIVDPDNIDPNENEAPCWAIDIAPENPGGIPDQTNNGGPTNVFVFSVTKGAYFPMQLEPDATESIRLRDFQGEVFTGSITKNDDGTLLSSPIEDIQLTFKPNTANNISTRPNIHTSFNMLGEDIDFLIYAKEKTPFNNYSNIFDLNENFIPSGLTPTFKVDANIPNSIIGSPTGVIFSKFVDRNKTQPIGWSFDNSGKVCIKTSDAYILASIPSGESFLRSYADLTINGHTYTNSLIAEDIYLKPIPNKENTNKYKRNALLTVDDNGKIISRAPRVNPSVPSAPTAVTGVNNGFSGQGNQEHSIEWSPPSNDGRSTIVNYSIQLSYDDGNTWVGLPNQNNTIFRGFLSQTAATIDQVPAPAIFRVAAQNSIGIGPYSEPTSVFNSNNNVPKMPRSFIQERNIDNENQSDITLSWIPTTSWGSSAAKEYRIDESTDNGNNWYTIVTIPYDENLDDPGGALRTHNETGLDGITNYLYRIAAINVSGGFSSYNYVYSTGLVLIDPDLEEEENRRQDELSNFDFNNILFTGICSI
jgi:hypothetical protein